MTKSKIVDALDGDIADAVAWLDKNSGTGRHYLDSRILDYWLGKAMMRVKFLELQLSRKCIVQRIKKLRRR